jgi:sugar/nucleoside kinase (ribokinase family)
MRPFQVCGLGNAIVDLFVEISHEELKQLNFEPGTMRLVEADEQAVLLSRFSEREPKLASGGSVANSVIGFTQLGGRAAFIGCVGDDRYGLFYHGEFAELGIEMGTPIIVGQTTGTCAALITPDAERTMRTCLGVSSHLAPQHVDENRIANSDWLFIEGYVLANPSTGQPAVREAVKYAKKHGTKIALTCSDAFIVHVFGDAFRETLASTDLLFCNATEAAAIAGVPSTAEAFTAIRATVPNTVITDGPHGAHFQYSGQAGHVPAFDCRPKDLTGAGDMFAGAFLYGICNGHDPETAVRGANYLAMKVISQIGARLHHDTKIEWQTGIARR